MERAPKSKGTIVLRYLQKAATFTITNNPHSPRGERLATIRGLSGPIGSIIPSAARHKKRSDDTFDEEPTSPKVTCIGQIKHKKTTTAPANERHNNKKKKKKIPSGLTRMLSQRQRVSPDHKKKDKRQDPVIVAGAPAPSLCQLKKFTSGRHDTLTNFDWEKASDDEEKEEDVMNIYHSAPLVLGGNGLAAEHKEVGLWRRRSVAALMPLELINK